MSASIEIRIVLDENDDGVKQDAYSLVTGKPSMNLIAAAAAHLAVLRGSTELIKSAAEKTESKGTEAAR